MASPELIEKSVEATFQEIKKYAPDDYAKIESDPYLKEAITEAARSEAAEEVDFDREFLQNPGEEVVGLLTDKLSEERVQMIQEAFSIPTFDMEVIHYKRKRGIQSLARVEFRMEGEEFLPPIELVTANDINWAKIWQYASIVIETVMLAMQAAGIKVAVSKRTMQAAVKDTAKAIKESSVMQKAMQTFIKSWKRAGGSNWAKAKAIFILLKDSSAAGLFWAIVKSLCKEMSWWDWIKTSAQVSPLFDEYHAGIYLRTLSLSPPSQCMDAVLMESTFHSHSRWVLFLPGIEMGSKKLRGKHE